MAAKADWPLYPVGPSTDPAGIPYMSCFGIVLIYLACRAATTEEVRDGEEF